jgi:predicted Fe-Mo cluster-binding NifX family protein
MGTVAIPTWNGRVSPVFDTASRLLVVEVGEQGESFRFETDIGEHFFPGKTVRLAGLGIETLICGAISRPFATMITGAGIHLIPWISGYVEEVLQAFLQGNLFDMQYLMPGCPRHWGKGLSGGRGRGRGRRRRGTYFP